MKVVVSKQNKNKRRSTHVFQCLVELIQRLLSPRITSGKLRAPWHESAMALFPCSNIVCVWCILRFDAIYPCASTTITLSLRHLFHSYFTLSVCLAMMQDVSEKTVFAVHRFVNAFSKPTDKCINVGSAVV